MNESNKTTLAAAIAGGYLLGRTKKAKIAFAVATYLAGRRFSLNPQEIIAQSARKIGESPQVGQLGEQVRHELVDALKTAVSSAANNKLNSFADALQTRTQALGGEKDEEPEDEEEGEEPEDEEEEDEEEDEDEEDEEEEDEEEDEDEEDEEDEEEEPEPEPVARERKKKTAKKAPPGKADKGPEKRPAPEEKRRSKKSAGRTSTRSGRGR
jgi:hypothetical protein